MQALLATSTASILNYYIIPILISLINTGLIGLVLYRFLQAFQIASYKPKEFFNWMKNTRARYMIRLIMVVLLSGLLLALCNILFGFLDREYIASASLIFYIFFVALYVYTDRKQPAKVELKYTHRLQRLLITSCIIVFVLTFLMIFVSNLVYDLTKGKLVFIRYGLICTSPLLAPFVMILAHYILLPFELWNNRRYIKKAVKKIDSRDDIVVIGVTGSFGKTSVKDILFSILKDDFSVVKTPNSFNTPLGLTRTILNDIKDDTQIFIAEMGARNKGDIEYLCNMVKPSYGVLTGITGQHLQSFGNIENIIQTKSELIRSLPKDGFAFFNGDNSYTKNIYEQCDLKNKFATFSQDCELVNNSLSDIGSEFTVKINGTDYVFKTPILGRHSVQNIILAILVAKQLGMPMSKIIAQVQKLEPTPHRLQPLRPNDKMIVLDDAYNSNPEGAKCALETLALFNGKKIIVTPGFLELGATASDINAEFAKQIAQVCDGVILVGKIQTKDIFESLRAENYAEENIIVAMNLNDAKEKLSQMVVPNSVVLFENDLPDNYEEVI